MVSYYLSSTFYSGMYIQKWLYRRLRMLKKDLEYEFLDFLGDFRINRPHRIGNKQPINHFLESPT